MIPSAELENLTKMLEVCKENVEKDNLMALSIRLLTRDEAFCCNTFDSQVTDSKATTLAVLGEFNKIDNEHFEPLYSTCGVSMHEFKDAHEVALGFATLLEKPTSTETLQYAHLVIAMLLTLERTKQHAVIEMLDQLFKKRPMERSH